MAIELTQDTLALVDLWREGTGLGRSAATEVLVHCALTQGLVLPRAEGEPVDVPEFTEPDLEEVDPDDADPAAAGLPSSADGPDDEAEATGSSTPASLVGTP